MEFTVIDGETGRRHRVTATDLSTRASELTQTIAACLGEASVAPVDVSFRSTVADSLAMVSLASRGPDATIGDLGLQPGEALHVRRRGKPANERGSESPQPYDAIDEALEWEDGWIQPKDPPCGHAVSGSKEQCLQCLPVPPWSVMEHPDFADLKLKHLAFHAYIRRLQYQRSGPMVLVDEPAVVSRCTGRVVQSTEALVVLLDRQEYRHVDTVAFETATLVDRFLSEWRATGNQRCGHLYGTYTKDTIPLGIRAVVAAIYEPPQSVIDGEVRLLADADEAVVDDLAKKLGMTRVGFIWTAVTREATAATAKEDAACAPPKESCSMTAREILRLASFQRRFASPCRYASSKRFGSKFVGVKVVAASDAASGVEVQAFQVSNRFVALASEGVIAPYSEDPSLMRLRPSSSSRMHPEIRYNQKDQNGIMMQHRAEPTFAVDFGIVALRHAFPKDGAARMTFNFKRWDFPAENRYAYEGLAPGNAAVLAQIGLPDGLHDWSLLVYLARNMPSAIAERAAEAVATNNAEGAANVSEMLRAMLNEDLSPSEQMLNDLKKLGFGEAESKAAIEIAGRWGIDAVIDWLTAES